MTECVKRTRVGIRTTFKQNDSFLQEVTSVHSDSERYSDSPAAHSDTPLTQLQKLKDSSNKTRRSLSVKVVKNKNNVKLERRKSDLEIQVKLKKICIFHHFMSMTFFTSIFVSSYYSGCPKEFGVRTTLYMFPLG